MLQIVMIIVLIKDYNMESVQGKQSICIWIMQTKWQTQTGKWQKRDASEASVTLDYTDGHHSLQKEFCVYFTVI